MSTILVSEHTIARMPNEGDLVLDVGCRAYDFALPMAEAGARVKAVEPDPQAPPPPHENILLMRQALLAPSMVGDGIHELVCFGNGTGNFVLATKPGNYPGTPVQVECVTMVGLGQYEIVKLDCEGAEYDILLEWPGPVANQITVEFHEHTGANRRGEQVYRQIAEHLGQWYDLVQHEKSVQHCIKTPNYWDSLWVLRDKI
jgi:FkbM family methyltransferase